MEHVQRFICNHQGTVKGLRTIEGTLYSLDMFTAKAIRVVDHCKGGLIFTGPEKDAVQFLQAISF